MAAKEAAREACRDLRVPRRWHRARNVVKNALLEEVAALECRAGNTVHEKWVAAWAEEAWAAATEKEPRLMRFLAKQDRMWCWGLRSLEGYIADHLDLAVFV